MPRPARKKVDIERAALELFVEKGIDGTSIRDIAVRAEVTEGALYRHHKSKHELVRALFFVNYEYMAEMIAGLRSETTSFREIIPKLVHTFYELYDQDPYVFNFIMAVRHNLLEELRNDGKNPVDLIREIVRNACSNGEITVKCQEMATQMMLGIVLQIPVAHRSQAIDGKLKDRADEVAEACLLITSSTREERVA